MRGIQQQRVVEVSGYRGTGLERTAMKGDFPGDTAAEGYRSKGLQTYGSAKGCAGGRAFGGYSSRGVLRGG